MENPLVDEYNAMKMAFSVRDVPAAQESGLKLSQMLKEATEEQIVAFSVESGLFTEEDLNDEGREVLKEYRKKHADHESAGQEGPEGQGEA